jgi:hypothetical protein
MKKICAFICLLFATNVLAQDLNLSAVMAGNTNDVICYVPMAPGDMGWIPLSISCDNKTGNGGRMAFGKGANADSIIAGFVGSGRWNLATVYNGVGGRPIFAFTRK